MATAFATCRCCCSRTYASRGFVVPKFPERMAEFVGFSGSSTRPDNCATAHVVDRIEPAANSVSTLFDGGNNGKVMVRHAGPVTEPAAAG